MRYGVIRIVRNMTMPEATMSMLWARASMSLATQSMFNNGNVEFLRFENIIFRSINPTSGTRDSKTGKSAVERMIGPAAMNRNGLRRPILVTV